MRGRFYVGRSCGRIYRVYHGRKHVLSRSRTYLGIYRFAETQIKTDSTRAMHTHHYRGTNDDFIYTI